LIAAKEMVIRNQVHGLDVRAVVLVGGRDFGRCPLAARLPTALWPLGDKPVLAHVLDHLADAGFRHAAVCCARDDAAAVEAACADAPVEVTLAVEELTGGTAGCLRDAVASDPGTLTVVLSASMLDPPALGELVAVHRAHRAELTMVFNPGPCGTASPGRPAEIYLCAPDVLHHIPPRGYCDIKEGLIPSLLRAGGTVRPIVLSQEAGNFHDRAGYLGVLETFFRRSARAVGPAGVADGMGTPLVIRGAEVSAHPTVRLCGPVLLGDRVRLAEGVVVIGPAVIGRDVEIEANSVIVRSALWANARVGPRCKIRESIVDGRATLPAGTEMVARTAAGGRFVSAGHQEGWLRRHARSWLGLLVSKLPDRASHFGSVMTPLAAGVLLLAGFLWCYWPTLTDLIGVWRRSDEYSAGLLVPFLAAYVLWLRRPLWRSTPVRPALGLGIGLFLLAQTIRGIGLLDLYSFVERFSLILSLAALVLLVAGRKYLARTATILLFLCLMFPWPGRLQNAITVPLQSWSTTAAVFCLQLVGYEVRQDGNVIHIGNASVAVAEACNGLRMITAFVVISGLVVLLVQRTWWEKLILLGSSLPIAFLCNTLRLAVTAVAFTVIQGEKWEQRFHDWGGYAMMPLALALVIGELWFLARLTTPPQTVAPAVISRRHAQHVPDG
jgi:exosortase